MPELPEVETIVRSLSPLVTGVSVSSVDVRCAMLRRAVDPSFVESLCGRDLVSVRRRAKYMLFDLDDGRAWIVHLGMSGRLVRVSRLLDHAPRKHDHVIVTLSDGAGLVFHDPRRFGLMTVEHAADSPLLAGIGPEPLEDEFNAGYLAGLRRHTRRTIKDVLMDQRVVAGLGNIYVNELLFTAGVRPRRKLARMSADECARVVAATRSTLTEAIEHRGSSISDFLDGIGRRGAYQWRRRVYDREGEACRACATLIKAVVVGQRSSFYCPRCQR